MQTFKSKVGFWYIGILLLIVVLAVARLFYNFEWVGLVLLMAGCGIMIDFAFRTYYRISADLLFIRCGFLTYKVRIDEIVRISETHNPVSSPALSLDRLEILYNKFDTVLISPKDKHGFIAAIKNIKPEVEVRLRK